MAQNGMFRNAFKGFNKQDVLQYIDEITAAWDEERKELEQRAKDAEAAQQQLQTAAEEAQALAATATEQQQVAETQLAEAQQQLYDTTADLTVAATTIEEMATQLEELQHRMAQLEQELATTADERDNAIAALADAKEQLAAHEATTRQLGDSRREAEMLKEKVAAMQQTIQRYDSVLGNADTVHQKVAGIVRPYMEQTARQTEEAMDSLQDAVDGILTQLAELQSSIDQQRQSVQKNQADSDRRLSAALDQWLATARDANGQGRRFFQ